MEFSPFNPVVKLCLQGMDLEEKGRPEEAIKLFQQSWNEATNSFEKFLAAHFIARQQKSPAEKIKWLETALEYALKADDLSVKSALPSLYSNIATCYEDLNDRHKANENFELAASYQNDPSDKGPFYHGTKADLPAGDLLTAGGNSNYKVDTKMKHIYFTALS